MVKVDGHVSYSYGTATPCPMEHIFFNNKRKALILPWPLLDLEKVPEHWMTIKVVTSSSPTASTIN